MVFTILVLVPEVGRSFNTFGSSEHWASLDFHKDIAGACVDTPTSLRILRWVLIWLSVSILSQPLPILLLLRLVTCAYLRRLDKILCFF